MSDRDAIRAEALRILKLLIAMPFEDCCALSRDFEPLPSRSGLYVIKHQQHGILYIGKSGNVKGRLRGGHKALGWAFIDRFSPDDVRVGAVILSFQWSRLSSKLESIILQHSNPPYNERISQSED